MTAHGNRIDMRTLDSRFTQGVVYSIYEGLLPGHSLSVIHDQLLDYKTLEEDFPEEIDRSELAPGLWEFTIIKKEKQGCCGSCNC